MRISDWSSDVCSSDLFAGAGAIYGSAGAFMAPDIYHTHYLLVLGSNPRVSHWTLVSAPNDIDVIKQVQRRGGKVRFVNPISEERRGGQGCGSTLSSGWSPYH